jgi:toxin ParE1/3/4
MAYKIFLSPEAEIDYDLTYEYYLGISFKVADRFKEEFIYFLEKIEINPYLEIRYKDYRFIPMNRFPFVIIYNINEETNFVEVRAVFYTSRDPFDYPDVDNRNLN